MPKPLPTTPRADSQLYEEETVHEVYEAIAPHFARTRFKPWPLIQRFLASLPTHALGLDAGAGNGKYLPAAAASSAFPIAVDRSQGLLDIAKGQLESGAECVRGDICDAPWRPVFDFAISVAAIHHLSTPARRAEAVRALLRPLRLASEPSRFFIYVWAYEQGPASRRKMGSLADGEVTEGERVQDVLVPWVVKGEGKKGSGKEGEVGEDDAKEVKSGEGSAREGQKKEGQLEGDTVYHRYYHLFVKGELRQLVETAAREEGFALGEGDKWLRVVDEGWEADNWWIEGEVGATQ